MRFGPPEQEARAPQEDKGAKVVLLRSAPESVGEAAPPGGRVFGLAALALFARRVFSRLAGMFRPGFLLLAQDVSGLVGVVARRQGYRQWRFSEMAHSRAAEFPRALEEVRSSLEAAGVKLPRRVLIASRFVVPARIALPLDPAKSRPAAQMREIVRSEIEPVAAEFATLWSIGAVLAGRGLITAHMREQVVLELALRREQGKGQVFFGQLACELGFIQPQELEASLHLQEKLQMLEANFACGWAGFAGEEGQPPVWLGAATGLSTWNQYEATCRKNGLKLAALLPLIWSASETEDRERARERRVALEIHGEEVVAVLREKGRVVASRNEGRMERALAANWLLGMASDWRADETPELEIICLEEADAAAFLPLLEDLEHQWGKAPRLLDQARARQELFAFMARQQKLPRPLLPVIRFGLPRKAIWRRALFWQLFAPILALSVAAGVEIQQRLVLKELRQRYAKVEVENQKQSQTRQQEGQALAEINAVRKNLDEGREKVARLMPEVERFHAIEGMARQLPNIMRMLARTINDDVVLEGVQNSRSASSIGHVQVIGWSPSYSSAQMYAQQVQETFGQASGLNYVVAQTNVKAAPGRDGSPGYQVSFWLVPTQEELAPEELGAEMEEDTP
ncbi:MAG: hypothetical protein LBO79_04730 [Zoogloeaceae bacterium]|jgi:hypothetical protein|nr:hypothetical protein [Zoogloeaceae bacterium]